MSKSCPVPGCGWTIAAGSLMCGHHWQLLPETLRRDLRNAKLQRPTPQQCERLQTRILCHFESVSVP